MNIQARQLDKIMPKLPYVQIKGAKIDKLLSNKLQVRPKFEEPLLLIGGDFYNHLAVKPVQQLANGFWISESKLGDILSGEGKVNLSTKELANTASTTSVEKIVEFSPNFGNKLQPDDDELNFMVEQHNKLETIGLGDANDRDDNAKWIQNFEQNLNFNGERYEVRLSWKEEVTSLPDNYYLALGRLKSNFKKLREKPCLLKQYHEIINDQLEKGMIERVESSSNYWKLKGAKERDELNGVLHYLPHHFVERQDKQFTKIRVVFDASSKLRKEFPSLNECLNKGPNLYNDLAGILLRARLKPVLVTCDVEKAFLQISIHPDDRDALRFLWYEKPEDVNSPIVEYRFSRVTFGVICSPAHLSIVLKHHFAKYQQQQIRLMEKDTYVDNIVLGIDQDKTIGQTYRLLKTVFQDAGMNVREFVSNDWSEIEKLPEADRGKKEETKLLGVGWDLEFDKLTVKLAQFPKEGKITRRTILSQIAKSFDPLGIVSPIILKGKLLRQSVEQNGKLKWDTIVDQNLASAWMKLMKSWDAKTLSFSRRYFDATEVHNYELHGFSDASEMGLGCAIYLRASTNEGAQTQLAFAKSLVVPTQLSKASRTIPSLELHAAKICCNNLLFVKRELEKAIKIDSVHFWTDSTELSHVDGKFNPADYASRGCLPEELMENECWFFGPNWLCKDKTKWPKSIKEYDPMTPNENNPQDPFIEMSLVTKTSATEQIESLLNYEQFSQFRKCRNTLAYVLRAVQKLKASVNTNINSAVKPKTEVKSSIKQMTPLTVDEIERAETHLWKEAQKSYPPSNETILNLNLFQKDGIWRAKGRMQNSGMDQFAIHPIYLNKNCPIVDLIIMDIHRERKHTGMENMVASLRSKFWIPSVRSKVNSVLRINPNTRCWICARFHAKAYEYPEAPPLPSYRRFVRRWKIPQRVVSDNGTNFVLGNKALTEIVQQSIKEKENWLRILKDEEVQNFSNQQKIEWIFISPFAPWRGGQYEQMNNDFDAVSVDCEEMEQALENENKEEESKEERKGNLQFPVEERRPWGGVAEKRVVINAHRIRRGQRILVHSLRDIAWWHRLPEVVTINDVCQMIVVRTTEWAEHILPFLSFLGRWAKPAVWIGQPIHVDGVAWLEPAQTVELDINRLVFMGAPRIVQRGGSALYKKRYQSDDHSSGAKRFRPVEDPPSHSKWAQALRSIRPVEDQPSHSGWTQAVRPIRPVEDLQQHQSSSSSHHHHQQPFPAKAVYNFWELALIPPIPPFIDDRAPFCRRVRVEKGGELLGFFNQQFYFSNFNEVYEFIIHGRTYRCVEQYYCAQKTLFLKRFDAADAIMLGTNKYGKRISPFEMKKIASMDGEDEVTIRDWSELKVGIMKDALKAKFSVHELRNVLLSTGSAIICELSPDKFWGVGCRPGLVYDRWPTADLNQWHGTNVLGRLMMELRKDLMDAAAESTPKGTTQAVQPIYGWSKNGEENVQNIPVEEDLFDLKSFENLEITITDEAEKGHKPKNSTNANLISELLMSHANEVSETEEIKKEKFALSERINQWLKYAGINCQVLVFGSSLCQLARHGSDLDLFVYKFDQTSIRLGDELAKVRKILRQKYPRTEMELRARGNTPVLKIKLEFHVDLTIGRSEKLNGVYNSVWLATLVRLNDLFRSVCLLIKEWGTDINRPEFGSFNSLSLVIMVQCYFAEQKLLPSLFRLYPDIYKEDKIVRFYDAEFHQELAEDAKTKCPQSTPSLIEVLTDFFLWLDDIDFARTKLSAKSGRIDRTEGNGLQSVIIEEPFDAKSNCSRSLTNKEFQNFKSLLRRTNTSLKVKDWYSVKRLFRLKSINDAAWSMTDESEDDSFDKIAVEQINESMKRFAGIKRLVVSQQGFAIEEREFVKFNRQLDRTRRDVNFGEPLDGEVRTSQLDAQLTARSMFADKEMRKILQAYFKLICDSIFGSVLGTDLTHLNPNFLIRQLSDNQQIEAEWISQNILKIWPCSPVYEYEFTKTKNKCYEKIPIKEVVGDSDSEFDEKAVMPRKQKRQSADAIAICAPSLSVPPICISPLYIHRFISAPPCLANHRLISPHSLSTAHHSHHLRLAPPREQCH
ncbi:hypothetical protein niasHT_029855 [Heterodera trifolii]|uniref:Uncharacterized protein n=1 Tax=Heterodera trifolii TaxID=157864 RepID=A0ABD2K5H1_9BILA